ncbi:DUF5928 domain-containing protein [Leisingera sp. F5]|nr:DUF5928 domain-containing protein [Leisingera sp. F5]
MRDAGFSQLFHMRESSSPEENAGQLRGFLGLAEEKAMQIAGTHYLFAD